MMSRYWSKLGIDQTPLYAVLAGRTSGSRSLARRVCSWAQVKSSVNQPSIERPSTTLVVFRPANSGWSATSVVPLMSFSCRQTSTWSLVDTMSHSTKSAPSSLASS